MKYVNKSRFRRIINKNYLDSRKFKIMFPGHLNLLNLVTKYRMTFKCFVLCFIVNFIQEQQNKNFKTFFSIVNVQRSKTRVYQNTGYKIYFASMQHLRIHEA